MCSFSSFIFSFFFPTYRPNLHETEGDGKQNILLGGPLFIVCPSMLSLIDLKIHET